MIYAENLNVCDDLHGTVVLDPTERRIMDTRWFQRLRHIRQLGLAHMVFPGAEHTRFAHSLGAFHLAIRLSDKFTGAMHEEERRHLRAAALLHDIGHFPFSHTLEKVYEDLAKESPEQWTEAPDGGALPPLAAAPTNETQFHEDFGRQIIENTDFEGGLTRLLHGCGLNPKRVGAIMVGTDENVLLNQIIHSDLDVDQLDYLLRDAEATGSSYGQYDLNYLFECLEVVYLDNKPVLCVSMQGIHPLEHYVLSKYFYYTCILYQKTRCVAEGLLQSIVKRLIAAGRLPSWDVLQAGLADRSYCDFDDIRVWETVRSALEAQQPNDDLGKAIGDLVGRRLPKVKWESHLMSSPGQTVSEDFAPGPDGSSWNPVVREAVERQCRQKFTVLKQALHGQESQEALEAVLTSDSRPIRMLVRPPYRVPKDIPRAEVTDDKGRAIGEIVLLETLRDSVVAKLAGHTTHICRVYRPA